MGPSRIIPGKFSCLVKWLNLPVIFVLSHANFSVACSFICPLSDSFPVHWVSNSDFLFLSATNSEANGHLGWTAKGTAHTCNWFSAGTDSHLSHDLTWPFILQNTAAVGELTSEGMCFRDCVVGLFEIKNISHLGTEEIPFYLMFKGKHQNNRAEDTESPQYEHYSLILSHASVRTHWFSHSSQTWMEWLESFLLPGGVSGTRIFTISTVI